jgi:ribose 5-phosphate isomerase RpiB
MMAGQQLDLDWIVHEVVRRLQAQGHGGGTGTEQPAATLHQPAGASPRLPPQPASEPVPGQLRLNQRVVTMAALANRLDGLKEVVVASGTLVTPSVRDELRKRGVALTVATDGMDSGPQGGSLLVGVAGNADKAGALLAAIRAEAGDAERFDRDCVIEVAWNVAQTIVAEKRIGLVLTRKPAVAVCLANRQPSVRAAWAVNVASVKESLQTIGANLLVINPDLHSLFELRGMVREFVQGSHQCPPAYRKSLGT